MESISEDAVGEMHGGVQPSNTNTASIDVATPRGAKRTASHRRVRSIVVGGAVELNKIKKEQEVETLHSELEKQHKALEASQEEAQLAARIGQSLLVQNQQLDYEMESKLTALKHRSEEADQHVKMLEQKLHDMTLLHREKDLHHTQLIRENDALLFDLSQAKAAIKPLKDELAKAKDEVNVLQVATVRLQSDTTALETSNESFKRQCCKLEAERAFLVAQVSDLRDVSRENDVRIHQLTASLAAMTQKYDELQDQFDFLSDKHAETTQQLEALTIQHQRVQEEAAIAAQHVAVLTSDVDSMSELLEQERQMTQDVLQQHNELVESIANGNPSPLTPSSHRRQPSEFFVSNSPSMARSDSSDHHTISSSRQLRQSSSMDDPDRKPSEFDVATMLHHESAQEKRRAEVLKRGSLFHELSIELEKEFMKAKQRSWDLLTHTSCTNCSALLERESELTQQVATLTLEVQHLREISGRTSPVKAVGRRESTSCTTCSLLMHREAEQTQHVVALSQEVHRLTALVASMSEPLPEENVLKEFFVLTAAAIKIAGAGIHNDRCNIANEALFDQAMLEDITFERFHDWIHARLESPP
ncbi:hypothetical protein H310_06203 [Aphanomyces invadans]|uniref:Uncharacterized protein n=1 Tax=Aphanomyces invadans TaxID=157072 RepID=A0A024U7H3_9STRA|nr:hypothetical protein H310_06203 [Aphanomyces invadans]ETW01548.1 hypothetical protein H310_06203 [Aphanomyces invadans]|eukprot:XP_008869396.1 hypothetical protein H310_06203 [Aphanomyces invadans]